MSKIRKPSSALWRVASGPAWTKIPCPVVIGVIGTGVVLEGVDGVEPDGADRPPGQVAEADDQVRRHAPAFAIELFAPMGPRADIPTVGILDGLDLGDAVAPDL